MNKSFFAVSLVPLNLLPLGVAARAGEGKERMWMVGIAAVSLIGIMVNGYLAVTDCTTDPSPYLFWSEEFAIRFSGLIYG